MPKMHDNEVHIDATLVHQLLAEQFPKWADLPIKRVESAGTENSIYRLGDEMCVRLSLTPNSTSRIEKEYYWLPKLAPHLPLAVPTPLAKGVPNNAYPFEWSVYDWIDGETLTNEHDTVETAQSLAHFILALQRIDASDGPPPGEHNFGRGVPLIRRDTSTRKAIEQLHSMIDTKAATRAWEQCLNAPVWDKPPVWIHGDLIAGNLLHRDGKLGAVIDFGGLGVGDPACDLMPAWTLFSSEARQAFRDVLQVDDATWGRGRGWALSFGVIALPYYHVTNPTLAGIARRAIDAVLGESYP